MVNGRITIGQFGKKKPEENFLRAHLKIKNNTIPYLNHVKCVLFV